MVVKLDNLFDDERTLYALRTTIPFVVAVVIGYIFLLIYTISFIGIQFIAILGSSTLVVGGFLLSGIFLGFLFGVPRTILSERIEDNNRIEANTNLEQISDWLTKILVGVGLTQLQPILSYTKTNLIDNLSSSFGKNINGVNDAIATSTTIGAFTYFLVCGFLIGYLWSRVYLTQSLQDEYNNKFSKVEKKVNETKLFSSRVQLVRQIIDSIPPYKYNNTLDFAYLKSKKDKFNTYQKISNNVDKLLTKIKKNLINDDLNIPSNLDDFLNSVYEDISRDEKFFFLRAFDYVNLGTILALKTDYKRAITLFDKALEINVYYHDAYIFKGLALWYVEEYEQAISSFDNAIDINNRSFSAWNNKCAVLLDKFKHQKNILSDNQKKEIIDLAFDTAEKAIKINPDLPLIHVNKGFVCSILKKYDEELLCYQKALEIDNKYPLAWYNQACYYASRGNDKEQALKSLNQAIQLNQDLKEYAREEEDFESLRNDEEFKSLVN